MSKMPNTSDFNDEIFEFEDFTNDEYENPFDEEFDKNDVVNSKLLPNLENISTDDLDELDNKQAKADKLRLKAFLSQADVDRLVNYDEDKRKSNSFSNKFSSDTDSVDISPDDLYKSFQDFLVVPKITGVNSKIPHRNRLPSDFVKDRGDKVEISDDPSHIPHTATNATVMVNRDTNGEVESIEVVCSCGEHTLIKFDYSFDEKDKLNLTEIYNKPIREPRDFKKDESINKTVDPLVKSSPGFSTQFPTQQNDFNYDVEASFIKEGIDSNLRVLFDNLLRTNGAE